MKKVALFLLLSFSVFSITAQDQALSPTLSFAQMDDLLTPKKEAPILLFANAWNPLDNWEDWQMGNSLIFQEKWQWHQNEAYRIALQAKGGYPLVDGEVRLIDEAGKVHWTARTNHEGKAVLWAQLFEQTEAVNYQLVAHFPGETYGLKVAKKNELNVLKIPIHCKTTKAVDIQFVIDATSSMNEEIAYFQDHLSQMVRQVKRADASLDIRTSSVFYRDHHDEYITRSTPFGALKKTLRFMRAQRAAGGGDEPEALDLALEVAVNEEWREQAVARLLFLVLDAPPRRDKESLQRLQKAIRLAAEKGIRIIPISPGILGEENEFLLQSLAAATNGTYLYFANAKHEHKDLLDAAIARKDLSALDQLLVQLIGDFAQHEDCSLEESLVLSEEEKKKEEKTIEHTIQVDGTRITYYPNPTSDQLHIELEEGIDRLSLFDLHGRLIQSLDAPSAGKLTWSVSTLVSGMYILRFQKGETIVSEQVVKVE